MVTDLRGALDQASVPTLLLCLAQVTGDPRWFEDRYRPRRDTNLFADESGGLPVEVQDEIRAAIVEMLAAIDSGALVVPPPPGRARRWSSSCGCAWPRRCRRSTPRARWRTSGCATATCTGRAGRPAAADGFRVLIVGAGVSGIAAGVKLRRAGHRLRDRRAQPRRRRHLVRQPLPRVGRRHAQPLLLVLLRPQPGLVGLLLQAARGARLPGGRGRALRARRPDISLGTEVVSMRWDDADLRWEVRLRGPDGRERVERPDAVITATGQMNRPEDPAGRHRPLRGRLVPLGRVARGRADRRSPRGRGRHRRQRHAAAAHRRRPCRRT